MWQEAPAELKDALYQVLNQVIQNGKMPTSWEGPLTTLIPKNLWIKDVIWKEFSWDWAVVEAVQRERVM